MPQALIVNLGNPCLFRVAVLSSYKIVEASSAMNCKKGDLEEHPVETC